jgi:hypothetical protein
MSSCEEQREPALPFTREFLEKLSWFKVVGLRVTLASAQSVVVNRLRTGVAGPAPVAGKSAQCCWRRAF